MADALRLACIVTMRIVNIEAALVVTSVVFVDRLVHRGSLAQLSGAVMPILAKEMLQRRIVLVSRLQSNSIAKKYILWLCSGALLVLQGKNAIANKGTALNVGLMDICRASASVCTVHKVSRSNQTFIRIVLALNCV